MPGGAGGGGRSPRGTTSPGRVSSDGDGVAAVEYMLWGLAIVIVCALLAVGALMLVPKNVLPSACAAAFCYPHVTFANVTERTLRNDACTGLAATRVTNPMGVAALTVHVDGTNRTLPIWGDVACASVAAGALNAYRTSAHGVYNAATCPTLRLGYWPVLTDSALNLQAEARAQALAESVYHIQKYWDSRVAGYRGDRPFDCWVCRTSYLVPAALRGGVDDRRCAEPGVVFDSPEYQDDAAIVVGGVLCAAGILLAVTLACVGGRAIASMAVALHRGYTLCRYGRGVGTKRSVKYIDEQRVDGVVTPQLDLSPKNGAGRNGGVNMHAAPGSDVELGMAGAGKGGGMYAKSYRPVIALSPAADNGRIAYSPASQREELRLSREELGGGDACAVYRSRSNTPNSRGLRSPSPGVLSNDSGNSGAGGAGPAFPPLPDPMASLGVCSPRSDTNPPAPVPAAKGSLHRWQQRRANASPHDNPSLSGDDRYSEQSHVSLGMINEIDAGSAAGASVGRGSRVSDPASRSRRSSNTGTNTFTNTSSSVGRTMSSYDDQRSLQSGSSAPRSVQHSSLAVPSARNHTIQHLDRILEQKRKKEKRKKREVAVKELNATPGVGKRAPGATTPPQGVLSPPAQPGRHAPPAAGNTQTDGRRSRLARKGTVSPRVSPKDAPLP